MAKLTATQVAAKLGVTNYTVKRWYAFWEALANTDVAELNKLCAEGMPTLPPYETVGSRGDRIWNEDDIPELEAFKNWIPVTKNGIFAKYLDKEIK